MKPLTLKCDANPKDHATLCRVGACAGLTVQEGRKIALANLTAPQMREAAAWLYACAAEIERIQHGAGPLFCMAGCRTRTGEVNAAFCPSCKLEHKRRDMSPEEVA